MAGSVLWLENWLKAYPMANTHFRSIAIISSLDISQDKPETRAWPDTYLTHQWQHLCCQLIQIHLKLALKTDRDSGRQLNFIFSWLRRSRVWSIIITVGYEKSGALHFPFRIKFRMASRHVFSWKFDKYFALFCSSLRAGRSVSRSSRRPVR